MKKFLIVLLLAFCFLLQSKANATEIKDIESHWAKETIENAIKNDIIEGYNDCSFKPDKEITVAEYLKILIKSGRFVLVKEGVNLWPDYYISTAKANGLIFEKEFTDYNKKITRNEIAKITARYINVEDVMKSKNIFSDLEKSNKNDVLKLVKLNVIKGYDDGTYKGENNVTRAEAITIAERATDARKDLVSKRKYNIEDAIKHTNINKDANVNGIFENTRYEIKNGKIIIYDNGRYSKTNNYAISNANIDTKKVIKTLKALVDENSYTELAYIPLKQIMNQLVIFYGDNEMNVHYRNINFSITYYEDKLYELRRISQNETFSEECYMKIEIFKLWDKYSEFEKGNYIDEYKKQKLYDVLKVEFGKNNAEKILEYMLEKTIEKFTQRENPKEISEIKIFGDYEINYQKKIGDTQKFFISKVKDK